MDSWILISIFSVANLILAFTKTAQKIVAALNKICLIFTKWRQKKYEDNRVLIQKAFNDCGFHPLNLVYGGPGHYDLITKIQTIRDYLSGNCSFGSFHTHLSLYHFDTSAMKLNFEYFWNASNHFAKQKKISNQLRKLSKLLSITFKDEESIISAPNKKKIMKLTRLILDELQKYQTLYKLDTHNLLNKK